MNASTVITVKCFKLTAKYNYVFGCSAPSQNGIPVSGTTALHALTPVDTTIKSFHTSDDVQQASVCGRLTETMIIWNDVIQRRGRIV